MLVTSTLHNFNFIELYLLNHGVFNYKLNTIALIYNNDGLILKNLLQKLKHPMLTCDYKYVCSNNNIIYNIYFSTHHTFTSSPTNSLNLDFLQKSNRPQYLNTTDFIINQNKEILQKVNHNNYLIENFKEKTIRDITIPQMREILFKNKQPEKTQIMYINNNMQIKINPVNWIKYK